MKRNGFTLIELLAVIVILAIIALIATPIILGIINDAREESNERSVELYASAVKNGIAAYQLREGKEVASGSYTTDTLPMEVEYEGDVECASIDIYEDGGVYVANCKVNDLDVDYTYGTKQEKVVKINDVCSPITVATEGVYTAGDKYECKVDPNKDAYIFYVLTTVTDPKTESVNLIMDSNIVGSVEWINKNDYIEAGGTDLSNDDGPCQYEGFCSQNEYGPITAMNHLQTATSNWTNLNTMIVSTFTDETGATYNMGKTYTTYSRLPYYSELSSAEEWLWLISLENYWVMTAVSNDVLSAHYVDESVNYAMNYGRINTENIGVRPVITLSI